MKTRILSLLALLFTTCVFLQTGNKAANPSFARGNPQELAKPPVFYGTIDGPFIKKQDVILIVLNSQNEKKY